MQHAIRHGFGHWLVGRFKTGPQLSSSSLFCFKDSTSVEEVSPFHAELQGLQHLAIRPQASSTPLAQVSAKTLCTSVHQVRHQFLKYYAVPFAYEASFFVHGTHIYDVFPGYHTGGVIAMQQVRETGRHDQTDRLETVLSLLQLSAQKMHEPRRTERLSQCFESVDMFPVCARTTEPRCFHCVKAIRTFTAFVCTELSCFTKTHSKQSFVLFFNLLPVAGVLHKTFLWAKSSLQMIAPPLGYGYASKVPSFCPSEL